MKVEKEALEFEWDIGNRGKNLLHKVTDQEAEEPFLDEDKIIFKDKLHSTDKEERFVLIGKTKNERLLYIIFTRRETKVRIISVRDINKKEKPIYEKAA